MSTIELKECLIKQIKNTTDENLLEEIYRLLGLENKDTEIYTVNEELEQYIQTARTQIKQGQSLTDENANKEIDEWLNK